MHHQFIFSSFDGPYKRIMKFVEYFIPYFLFYVFAPRTWIKQESPLKPIAVHVLHNIKVKYLVKWVQFRRYKR